ncbi:MAG: hypothetical protein ND807_05310 [Vicinamibacterales bacterium]|nr:hypothetical protein [Vicinamibacterales bacterium]
MRTMLSAVFLSLVTASAGFAQGLKCDMTQYKGTSGLTAAVDQDLLVVTWAGQGGSEVRARYAIERGQPVVRELAVKKQGGQWATLGQNLSPEYHVVSGLRRMSSDHVGAFPAAGIPLTPEIVAKNRWFAFHDAPLEVPGRTDRQQMPPMPRKPEEIRRADATFNVTGCSVKTDGTRLEVTFPGLSMGIFSGSLQFTVYRGTNLIRMDAVAKTEEQFVAYKFDAGLKGFSTDTMSRVIWRDTSDDPQQYQFGGVKNNTIVPLKARNRVLVAEGKGGSLATFPPPHKFFWAREIHVNQGYVWYRKDGDKQFGMGVRQAEHEESEKPGEIDDFALYNAPPGTMQRMGMYFYASPDAGEPTRQSVLAFTHADKYQPIAGYKTFTNHWHLRFTERVRATGSMDTPLPDLVAMKAMGLNIVGLSDFHGDMNGNDAGALRFKDQKDYFEASRRASDKDFLVVPWEEPNVYFGGHYNLIFPKPVYYSRVRKEGQPFTETDSVYGKVYHLGSSEDLAQLMTLENGYWYTSHPRTKNSAGQPDVYWDKPFAKNDIFLGLDFTQAMGVDLSEKRMSEYRSFDSTDTMNNLNANTGLKPKVLLPDIDTYQQGPEDNLYSGYQTAYLKLDKVPGPDEDWSPVLKAMHEGNFFVTTGEVLIKSFAVEGTGAKRTVTADVDWTFPLEFVEVVWGDGKKIDRQIISATDLPAFGSKHFSIPFDATGKAWVRFAAWDSAGNPGFVNAVWLNPQRLTTQK